jgi:quercetin dioxygenase-like cupin family protein
VLLSAVVVVLLGVGGVGVNPVAVAQEASPASGMSEEGVSYEPVAFALGAELPSAADLFVIRLGLDPGAGFPIEASDPSSGMLIVESGAFTVRVEVPLAVTRGAGLLDAIATAEATGDFASAAEAVAAGEEVTLEAGDAVFIPGNTAGEVRNDGQERAVGLAFLAAPPEGMGAEATPIP